MKGSIHPPKGVTTYYVVDRHGARYTITSRFFRDLDDAVKYYDERCRTRTFVEVTLSRYTLKNKIWTIDTVYSTGENGKKYRDIYDPYL